MREQVSKRIHPPFFFFRAATIIHLACVGHTLAQHCGKRVVQIAGEAHYISGFRDGKPGCRCRPDELPGLSAQPCTDDAVNDVDGRVLLRRRRNVLDDDGGCCLVGIGCKVCALRQKTMERSMRRRPAHSHNQTTTHKALIWPPRRSTTSVTRHRAN